MSAITRPVVIELRDRVSHSQKRHAIAVLSNIMRVGLDHGIIAANPTSRPGIKATPRRQAVWTLGQIDTLDEQLRAHGRHGAALAIRLLQFTGQRPGDVCKLTWNDYHQPAAGWLRFRQQKTGRLVELPAHRDLRALLDAMPAAVGPICLEGGRPLTADSLRNICLPHMRALGLGDLQIRDLRRTACVHLGEAGCELQEVAAITGHALNDTAQIMETYMPRSQKMAAKAITKLEQIRGKNR